MDEEMLAQLRSIMTTFNQAVAQLTADPNSTTGQYGPLHQHTEAMTELSIKLGQHTQALQEHSVWLRNHCQALAESSARRW